MFSLLQIIVFCKKMQRPAWMQKQNLNQTKQYVVNEKTYMNFKISYHHFIRQLKKIIIHVRGSVKIRQDFSGVSRFIKFKVIYECKQTLKILSLRTLTLYVNIVFRIFEVSSGIAGPRVY